MPADIISLVIGTIAEIAADPVLAKLGRSERVIHTLQKCGIEHLPSLPDFDTIYAYSLAHYGIDKPSQIREIFRDTWVTDAFRTRVYDRNTAYLESEIEMVIAREVEDGNTRYHRVDVRTEVIEFGRVFWDAVHKTRTPAEVETIHEIRDLRSEMATLRIDLARLIAQQMEPIDAQHTEMRSTEDHAESMRIAMQKATRSLAFQTLEEHRLHDYFAAGGTVNILRDQVFSILDSISLPVQVKYGIVGKVDFDLLRKQAGVLVVDSFDRNKAVARIEEVVPSLIDIEAVVLALTGFIEMKIAERSGAIRMEDLKGELEQLLVPFINDEEFGKAIGDAVETGLPDPFVLGTQIRKLCASAVEAAAGML